MPARSRKQKAVTPTNTRTATNTFRVPESTAGTSHAGSTDLDRRSSSSGNSSSNAISSSSSTDGSWHGWADRVEAVETVNRDLIHRIDQIEDRRAAAAPTQLFLGGVFLLGTGVVLPGWFGFPVGVWVVWFTVWLVFLSICNVGAMDILVRAIMDWWVKDDKGGGGDGNGLGDRADE